MVIEYLYLDNVIGQDGIKVAYTSRNKLLPHEPTQTKYIKVMTETRIDMLTLLGLLKLESHQEFTP